MGMRIGIFCAAVLVTVAALAGPAQAQIIKPLDVEQDPNGVDLLSGKVEPRMPELSVPGSPNLRMVRLQDLMPVLMGQLIPNTWGRATYDVNGGGVASDHFDCDEQGYCRSKKRNGAHITPMPDSKQFTYYQGGSAKQIFFDRQHGPQGIITSTSGQFTFLPAYVRYPGGEQLDYAYESVTINGAIWYRPTTVTSTFGYTMTLSYQSNDYYSGLWFTVGQATIYKSDNMSAPLARLTYSGNTITDLHGRTWNCVTCSNRMMGENATSSTTLRLPGETVDTFQATSAPCASTGVQWISQVTTDGVAYNYSFTPTSTYCQYISKVTVTAPGSFSRTVNIHSGYNIRPRITSIVNSLGHTTSYQYDNDVRVTKVTYPEGNAASVAYDALGNIIESRAIAKPGSGLADIVETAFYGNYDPATGALCHWASCFKPIWTRDAKGQQTDYTWSSWHGGLITKLEPADANGHRRKTVNDYDGYARLIREGICLVNTAGANLTCGTVQEQVRQFTYWGNTQLPLTETITDGAGTQSLTTTYSYDPAGRLLSKDGPLPGTDDATYYRHDIPARTVWEIGPKGANGYRQVVRTTFRAGDDQPLKVEAGTVVNPTDTVLAPLTEQRHAYDTRRQKVRTTLAGGGADHAVTQFSYDARNRLECTAIRMNPAAWGSLPASACTPGPEGSDGADRITRTIYDAESRVLTVQKAYGTSYQQDYATYSHSANGKQLTVKDANGNLASMTWDGHDRQTHWYFPSKTTAGQVNWADFEQYGYDANGNRTYLRKRDGTLITYAYDNLNRVTAKNVPTSASGAAGYAVYYGYDVGNRQTWARFGSTSGYGISNSYDSLGRLSSSTTNMSGDVKTLSYLYDAGSRRTRLTFPDGNFFTYEHDAAGNLTAIRENGGTAIAGFSYDSAGRRNLLNHTNGLRTIYEYDPVSRLWALTHTRYGGSQDVRIDFGYNPASQIKTRTYSNDAYAWNAQVNVDRSYAANGLNQYTAAGPASFLYDANGNLTSDGSTGFVYDAENRLVSASGTKNATLSYDPLGRLYQVSGGAAGTTRFLYDGDELVMEYTVNSADPPLRRYVHGAGVDDPIIWYEGGGLTSRRSLFADHQGSIAAVSDSSGNALAINSYDEWGIPNAGNIGRFQYTGQAWFDELGMYHYKARIYSPTLGRFMQTDPIGYEDQMNLYAYVHNDPVNAIDPSGRRCMTLSTSYCARAQIYASMHGSYRGRTTFFGAASLVSEALNEMNRAGAGLFTSAGTRDFFAQVNRQLFNINRANVDRIVQPGRSVRDNDRAFVRFEQRQVQRALDNLRSSDEAQYNRVVSEGSAALNGTIQSLAMGITDSAYANAVATARDSLGVENLDFGNEAHRVAIGDALTDSIRQNQRVVCTGSRIERPSC